MDETNSSVLEHGALSSITINNDQETLEELISNNVQTKLSDESNETIGSQDGCDTEDFSKPRIILTLRTSETDPDAYFSTSSLQGKTEKRKKARKSSLPLHSNQNSIPIDERPNGENTGRRRPQRRLPSNKESVLQNAIALKEKSFRVPDFNSQRKSKSPRISAEKSRQMRLKSSKLTSPADSPELPVTTLAATALTSCCRDQVDSPVIYQNGSQKSDLNSSSTVQINSNGIYDNLLADDSFNSASIKPLKKKRRYFKGLSYNFNNKRNSRRRRLVENNIRHRFHSYNNSIINVNAETQDILSEQMNGLEDSKITNTSQSPSTLLESDTGIKPNITQISLEVINDELTEKAPSHNVGDDSEKPVCPESTVIKSSNGFAGFCLCKVHEKVYMKVDSDTKYHCQAVDTIKSKQIGCCNPVLPTEAGDIILQRPSVKVAYLMFCEVHSHRLIIHNCCPACGFFCTQGKFAICASRHIYHRKCEVVIENKRLCPHCGQPSLFPDVSCVIGEDKNPVFLPFQNSARETPCAKMSFRGSFNMNDSTCISSPVIPSRSYLLPSGKEITTDGLPVNIDKEKLDKFLEAGIPCISNSPVQRFTYRTLYHAANTGDIEKTLNCLCYGLNPNHLYRELSMGSALHAASAGGFLTVVYLLRQAGAQLDLVDRDQNTSLMLAAINGHEDVLKYLIKAGADIAFKGKDGMTPLHAAAKNGQLESCHYLSSSPKAPSNYVNMVDDGGWTALIWAAEFNHINIVLYLLKRGADPLIRDNEQNVALHWAAFSGNVDITECLLHFNSDINCTNVRGDTPLHICARREHYPCVVLLLAQGARTDLRNADELLALDCCITKPCDSYNAIKLNIQLKEITVKSRKRTMKILTNDISRGYELNPIQCVNEVDNETKPTDFVYITENCYTSFININRTITSLKSCECTDSCNTASCNCGEISLGRWYTDEGKLCAEFNYAEPPMIFECNPMCPCNKITCNNRVVQHGSTARFQLFRTKSKGWGVMTLRAIPKGTYVCEYVGEIISDTEADAREEDSYLFDLDNRDGETYCIDAFRYGNIARFINHNCVPNLQPVKVFVGHQDLHFPRIAFFSNRDIEAYEELGFDYGGKFWIIKYKSCTCTCAAETCRYSCTTIHKTLAVYNKKLQLEESIS